MALRPANDRIRHSSGLKSGHISWHRGELGKPTSPKSGKHATRYNSQQRLRVKTRPRKMKSTAVHARRLGCLLRRAGVDIIQYKTFSCSYPNIHKRAPIYKLHRKASPYNARTYHSAYSRSHATNLADHQTQPSTQPSKGRTRMTTVAATLRRTTPQTYLALSLASKTSIDGADMNR